MLCKVQTIGKFLYCYEHWFAKCWKSVNNRTSVCAHQLLQKRIKVKVNVTRNQWELKVNTSNWRRKPWKAKPRMVSVFLYQSQCTGRQNQCNPRIPLSLNWKLLLHRAGKEDQLRRKLSEKTPNTDYKNILFKNEQIYHKMKHIRSGNHQLGNYELNKVILPWRQTLHWLRWRD